MKFSVPMTMFLSLFLMHRVELKSGTSPNGVVPSYFSVPNAPCGVEILLFPLMTWLTNQMFLMHRVELKFLRIYGISTG